MALAEGTLSISAMATYLLTKENQPYVDIPSSKVDCVGTLDSSNCFATPEWRGTVQAVYSAEDWTLGAKMRIFGEVDYTGSTDQIAQGSLGNIQSYLDVFGTYTFLDDDNAILRVGVNNILDDEPPMVGGTLSSNGNSIAGFYDTLGRFMYGKLTYKL
jgi:outer membrane receptor protein involved in Fe transport